MRFAPILVASLFTEFALGRGDDLVWVNSPRAWHQQLARIIDHRFTDFDTMKSFALDAKKAGVSALMLVQIQKTEACPGSWYNGLQVIPPAHLLAIQACIQSYKWLAPAL